MLRLKPRLLPADPSAPRALSLHPPTHLSSGHRLRAPRRLRRSTARRRSSGHALPCWTGSSLGATSRAAAHAAARPSGKLMLFSLGWACCPVLMAQLPLVSGPHAVALCPLFQFACAGAAPPLWLLSSQPTAAPRCRRPPFDNRVDGPIRAMNRTPSNDFLGPGGGSFRPGGRPGPQRGGDRWARLLGCLVFGTGCVFGLLCKQCNANFSLCTAAPATIACHAPWLQNAHLVRVGRLPPWRHTFGLLCESRHQGTWHAGGLPHRLACDLFVQGHLHHHLLFSCASLLQPAAAWLSDS